MAEHPIPTLEERGAHAWLPAALEVEAYEGFRLGEEAAFRMVAEPLQPVLLRLAGLAGGRPADAQRRVVRAWALALGGLDMFRWQTPFASWVAGITIGLGRSRSVARGALGPPVSPLPTRSPSPGPADWSDLPWSPRWVGAPDLLGAAFWRLPLAHREVVHAHDLERWPTQRVCEVLGLSQASERAVLAEGRLRLRNALAPLAGLSDAGPSPPSQIAAVVALLPGFLKDDDPVLDSHVLAAFRRWDLARRRRRRPWPRLESADRHRRSYGAPSGPR